MILGFFQKSPPSDPSASSIFSIPSSPHALDSTWVGLTDNTVVGVPHRSMEPAVSVRLANEYFSVNQRRLIGFLVNMASEIRPGCAIGVSLPETGKPELERLVRSLDGYTLPSAPSRKLIKLRVEEVWGRFGRDTAGFEMQLQAIEERLRQGEKVRLAIKSAEMPMVVFAKLVELQAKYREKGLFEVRAHWDTREGKEKILGAIAKLKQSYFAEKQKREQSATGPSSQCSSAAAAEKPRTVFGRLVSAARAFWSEWKK